MIVFGIMIVICLGVSVYLTIRAYKKENQSLDEIEARRRDEINGRISELQQKHELLELEINHLESLRQIENERIKDLKEQFKEVAEGERHNLNQELEGRRNLIEAKMAQEFENKRIDYLHKEQDLQDEITAIKNELNKFQSMMDSVNAAILREKQLQEQSDFYSVQINENDRADIATLQSMDLRLHNREVIPKLIWEIFVRRPVQEMIKRVLTGRESISGIYKVTNKQTGEAYIGRSSNIGTRWQNHCKTAIGLESAASSTFHTRLAKDGIWNYTWEILEEVPKENLGEREAFYIDLYGTKNQLNMKNGG